MGQGIVMGFVFVLFFIDCEQLVVVVVFIVQEMVCGNQDGKISIQVQDEDQDVIYIVILIQEKKQVQYSSFLVFNGMVKIFNLVFVGFIGFQVVWE